MRKLLTGIRIGPAIRLTVLALSLAVALTVLARADQTSANPDLTLGLDFDPSGTPANGVYNPSSLPAFEDCTETTIGGQVDVDLFVLDVANLVGFQSDIQYDGSKVNLVGSQVLLFLNSQAGSAVSNLSQNGPDPTTGVLTTPDSDGLYEAGAVETGNVSGDTGYGVLARLTFQGVGAGTSPVTFANAPAQFQGTTLTNDSGTYLNDGDGDGFYDDPFINETTGAVVVGQDDDGDGIPSDVCPGGVPDNCPDDPNPGQADLDSDGIGDVCDGDTDGDGYWNQHEIDMGSSTTDASRTPEVCDGTDNDLDGQTDEGYDLNSNGTPDCTDATADTDSDGTFNPSDPDDDNDGFPDIDEVRMRTDTLRDCPVTTSNHYWPPDSNNDTNVNIFDVVALKDPFFSSFGDPAFNYRVDMKASTPPTIDIFDVVAIKPFFFASC